MDWKSKSRIQRMVATFPKKISEELYYQIQRNFGGLRTINPESRLAAGIETFKRLIACGFEPMGKTFLELGTGRIPLTPIAYWLMGAKTTFTIDINRYVKDELIIESTEYILLNVGRIESLFGALLNRDRFNRLISFLQNNKDKLSAVELLRYCSVNYLAPCDATNLNLPSASIDFYTSYTVLEHIPEKTLIQIITEGNRVISKDGVFIHQVDYSDHFSHEDPNICSVNFLQYSESEWLLLAGNQFMYQNRLRHDDMLSLFTQHGHQFVNVDPTIDPMSLNLITSGKITPHEIFQTKPPQVLAIRNSWLVSCLQ